MHNSYFYFEYLMYILLKKLYLYFYLKCFISNIRLCNAIGMSVLSIYHFSVYYLFFFFFLSDFLPSVFPSCCIVILIAVHRRQGKLPEPETENFIMLFITNRI